MDKINRRGFELHMFENLILYGVIAFGLAWLIVTPVASGQEGKNLPQQRDATLDREGTKDAKKKAAESGNYKKMKKENEVQQKPAAPELETILKGTTGPGGCP